MKKHEIRALTDKYAEIAMNSNEVNEDVISAFLYDLETIMSMEERENFSENGWNLRYVMDGEEHSDMTVSACTMIWYSYSDTEWMALPIEIAKNRHGEYTLDSGEITYRW